MKRRRSRRPHERRPPGDEVFGRVAALARNLWWTWNPPAQRLFAGLDPALWETTGHNPLATLAQLSPARREALAHDPAFLEVLGRCEADLEQYLRAETWFDRTAAPQQKRLLVAYFCAEYGLHECLPQYAGGLGVLAGDHLKSASDLGVPLVAVGLLYRCGYGEQTLDEEGATHVRYPPCDLQRLPITDTGQRVRVPLGRREILARLWLVPVGRVRLYLLDTHLPENAPAERAITRTLYGGDEETRIQQEIVLGVGGVRALEKLGLEPTVYHLNEGHAAFCALERVRRLCQSGWLYDHAEERVWESTIFTTHTPVEAGHDRFDPALVLRYLKPLADDLGLPREEFLALGRADPEDDAEPFCMTVLALGLSERCNGVSKQHGEVSRRLWQAVYDADRPEDVPIGHVTNGVHAQTWLAPEIEPLYRRYLKPRWLGAGPDDDWWQNAGRIPAAELWAARQLLRRRLVHFVRQRLREQIQRRWGPVEDLVAALDALDEDALTIGFARRFATYKRAPLIFHDARRLARIIGDPARPVQLIFAGRAHPRDAEGQLFAQKIYQWSRRRGLRGRVVLLESYDMDAGRVLTAGCDVWLNTPLPPNEASGTSGMKAALHGVLHCSILDGWWPEAYNRRNGWAIASEGTARTRAGRDRQDAQALYDLLEQEIIPLFYERDRDGVPRRWVRRMVAAMKSICGRFNTHRMVAEYVRDYYWPALAASS